MRIYQVGGAVRDTILKRTCNDKDYVVIGATEQEMLANGFKKAGRSFPVFLHPETGDEYALARKEIKTGNGHQDFEFIFSPDITLEEDALRRDFTCNALYMAPENNEIIDFCGGKEDISKRILRHISDHFAEDPLRVLRMCRFAAQLNFTVAPETMELCRAMVKNGALKHLQAERIWGEFAKALKYKTFYRFIETAKECGALGEILPEVEMLWHIPERTDYHPEANSGAHTMLALKAAQTTDPIVNFTVLLHDVGKTLTDPARWPSHRGHDKLGEPLVKAISNRLKAPNAYADFASFATANHMIYHRPIKDVAKEMAMTAIILAHYADKNYFERYTSVLKADMLGRALSDFSCELECFGHFKNYLSQLTNTVMETRATDIPGFMDALERVKKHELPQSFLKEEYANYLLQKTPFEKPSA